MRVVRSGLALAVLMISVLTFPTAQAEPLAPDNPILWGHASSTPSCCTYFATTTKEDSGPTSVGATATQSSRTWAMAVTDGFDAPVDLDPDGFVHFEVYIGDFKLLTDQPVGVSAASFTLSAELMQGSQVVARTGSESVLLTPAYGIKKFEWDIVPEVARLDPADGDLQFNVRASGNGLLITMHFSGSTHTHVSLPVVEAESGEDAAATIFEDLAGPLVDHTFGNATSDTYVLNFTTDLVNSTADFAWNATAGMVNATLTDANGTLVYNGTFQGNGTLAHDVLNATAGPWNLTLAYSGFNGTFRFELRAPAGPDTSDDTGSDPSDGPGGNGTADLDDTKGNDAPLPLLVSLAGIAAAVGRRRWRMAHA